MGFFSAVKKFFTGGGQSGDEAEVKKPAGVPEVPHAGEAGESSAGAQPEEAAGSPAGEQKAVSLDETGAAAEPSEKESVTTTAEESAVKAESADTDVETAGSGSETQAVTPERPAFSEEEEALALALRQAEPRLSAWLNIVLDGVEDSGDLLWKRLSFLLRALQTPEEEARVFLDDFRGWLERMDYHWLEDFRSELQYRLALALDMEDEEDERDRLFSKLQNGLARTRARFGQGLSALISGHSELNQAFWDEMEELFIMADMGAEPSLALVRRLKERSREEGVTTPEGLMPLLEQEVEAIFKAPRRIAAVNPPEVILMVGVNGVGKTTTIAKLAYRARMQGKKVLIAAADTFRAAAVEQLEVWARRIGADFHAKGMGADPAAVAFEAMDLALRGGYDVLFIDTAGRLHTKSNLMDELHKIRMVVERKHPGAPHRTILVIDATTGQNALQQTKMFKDTSGVNEIILTKLDGTAKGGVALAVASQFELPITFIGLGEKMEDLRPFDPHDFARALLGRGDNSTAVEH